MDKNISIITPVYGCCKSINNLYERLNKSLSTITENFEIIMINDSSPDNAWEAIKELAQKDDRVKGINLSRNFGQHKAITAGLDYAKGDWIVVMDCDLQDQPEEIIKLYNKAIEGYDIVFGRRAERKDSFFKKLSSTLFYKVYDYFTESKIDNTIANFSIISKKVLDNLNKLKEQNRSYPLFVNWVGFKRTEINIEHAQREEGKSSYTFTKLMNLAIDSIVSQSNKPLKLSIKFGFIVAFLSLFYGIVLILKYFIFSIPIEGWTSVMVSIYFIGGLLFANMGILGLYIGKIFDETKNRPIYIVQETTFETEVI
ncbi:glycosyltransferase [Arcobacter cryaerophilus gv. occultus]|uniref:glycosyltransferase family 2 protein n=1 Tax=Aliarcobacter cryaerophilus TaxID=28198 RepID=UPI000D013650|nr:glycosyltransferase family 2 protein [Aliarcobacter cryaerophilus]PRM91337.1 glycosyltransferase [Arcobacter cryaerophilus gv. occultus]